MAIVLCAGLALWPALAAAETDWKLLKRDGRAVLQGHGGEYEGDDDLWLRCRADKAIDVGAGAESEVGKGKGETVKLTLTSAGKTATLSGVSRRSENWEMTGGTELRTRITRDDPLFAVLATGKPIAVTGPIKPKTWAVKGLKTQLAAFLKACK
jgi:hypothetical protein